MKKTLASLLSTALLGIAVQTVHASVVVSNLDPANSSIALSDPEIGASLLTGSRAISLTSVIFEQSTGETAGETFSVYSRNADGTLGSPLFTSFSLAYDSTSSDTTATASRAFTLAANTGYWFVLTSSTPATWNYTTSTDYAASFGASLPTTDTSLMASTVGGNASYYPLAAGPQLFQVHGSAAAVPEPSTWALTGLALAGGVGLLARRRAVAA